jgi:hypothetical protein
VEVRHNTLLTALIITAGVFLASLLGFAAHTDDTCAVDPVCRVHGRCTASFGFCVVGSDLDCRLSEACRKHGVCRRSHGACVR